MSGGILLIIVLFVVGILGLALFPGLNTMIGGMSFSGFDPITKFLNLAMPFVIGGAVLIAIFFMRRGNG